jgi:hypothetical protein
LATRRGRREKKNRDGERRGGGVSDRRMRRQWGRQRMGGVGGGAGGQTHTVVTAVLAELQTGESPLEPLQLQGSCLVQLAASPVQPSPFVPS